MAQIHPGAGCSCATNKASGAVTVDGGASWDAITVLGLGTIVDVAWDGLGGIIAIDSAGEAVVSTNDGFSWSDLIVPSFDLVPVALDRAADFYLAVAADGSTALYEATAGNGPDPMGAVGVAGTVVDITATGGLSGRRYLVVDALGNTALSLDDGATWAPAATIT